MLLGVGDVSEFGSCGAVIPADGAVGGFYIAAWINCADGGEYCGLGALQVGVPIGGFIGLLLGAAVWDATR
jgi:hypothetical protein